MASITASVNAVQGVVWLEVEFASDPAVFAVRVIRVDTLTGREESVRIHSWLSEAGVDCMGLVGSSMTLYDTEAPLDIPVYYRAEDCVDLAAPVTSNEVVVPSSGRLWLKDPVRPYANVPIRLKGDPNPCVPVEGVYFQSMGEETYPAGGILQRPVNRRNGIAVVRVRHGYSSTINLATRTFVDRDAVRDLLATGDVLMLQAPAKYGIDECYVHVVGAPAWQRLSSDHRKQWRVVGIPFDEVGRPAGLGYGVLGTRWMDLCDRYATFAAAEAAGISWRDVMAGAAGPSGESIVDTEWRTYAEVLGEFGTYAAISPYTSLVSDTFTRVVGAGSWGTATSGQAWTVDGTAAQYSVTGTVGQIAVNALNVNFRARLATTDIGNFDQTVQATLPATPTGNYIRIEQMFRWIDANNFYVLRTHIHTNNTVEVQLRRIFGGVDTQLDAAIVEATHVAATAMNYRIRAVGSLLQAKVWRNGTTEPADWELSTVDTSMVTGQIGVNTFFHPSNTNPLPVNITFDNLVAQQIDRTYLELLEGD